MVVLTFLLNIWERNKRSEIFRGPPAQGLSFVSILEEAGIPHEVEVINEGDSREIRIQVKELYRRYALEARAKTIEAELERFRQMDRADSTDATQLIREERDRRTEHLGRLVSGDSDQIDPAS